MLNIGLFPLGCITPKEIIYGTRKQCKKMHRFASKILGSLPAILIDAIIFVKKISRTSVFKVAKERTKNIGVITKNSKFLPVNVVSTCPLPQYSG